MGSGITSRRCPLGKRKISHASFEEALVHIKKQPGKFLKAYRCKCGAWHLAQNKSTGQHFQKFIDRVVRMDKKKSPSSAPSD